MAKIGILMCCKWKMKKVRQEEKIYPEINV